MIEHWRPATDWKLIWFHTEMALHDLILKPSFDFFSKTKFWLLHFVAWHHHQLGSFRVLCFYDAVMRISSGRFCHRNMCTLSAHACHACDRIMWFCHLATSHISDILQHSGFHASSEQLCFCNISDRYL